jgi:hypothetical protein
VRPLLVSTLLLALAGCTPAITPLYRDFEPEERSLVTARDSVRADVQEALVAAGWTLTDPSTEGFVTTEERVLGERLLYKVVASLDVAFVGDRAVRIYVHPYRRYVTGNRSKLAFLSGGVERDILPDLRRALEERGIVALGTARERDEEAREEKRDRAGA